MTGDELKNIDEAICRAECLIESREKEPLALPQALQILIPIEKDLRQAINGVAGTNVLDTLIRCLMAICAAYNHQGAVSEHSNRQRELQKLLHECSDLQAHGICANLNNKFNDYRFHEVIPIADRLLKDWESQEKSKGDVLGEIQGTLGQANAFLSRYDDAQRRHASAARSLFNKSRQCYSETSAIRYHAMAVNFLATLEWQEGQPQAALEAMALHPNLPKFSSPTDLAERIGSLAALANDKPFDVVNYLRIIESSPKSPNKPGLSSLCDAILHRSSNGYPHGLLARWAGGIAILAGDFDLGEALIRDSISAAEGQSFTIETLALPGLSLAALCAALQKRDADKQSALTRLRESAGKLLKKSAAFRECFQKSGGLDALESAASGDQSGARRALRFLPFTYS